LFFRDKANVFFSLLAVLIILGLYVLFLGNQMEQMMANSLGFVSDKIPALMAALVLGGMVAVTSITGCMGALGVSVDDKKAAANDFFTSPVSKKRITLSYILGSSVVGLIMTLVALVLCVAYIVTKGGAMPDIADMGRLLLTTVLSVLCGNAMVFFLTCFVNTQNAYSSVSTVLGTLIGFLMGIYIPIGVMPNAVQWVIKCFPMSHAAAMYKQILADGELSLLFANAPAEALESTREMFGIAFTYGDYTSGFWFSAGVLAVATVVFFALSLQVLRLRPNS
jgi:multidrug/hemolysin transport system permease protein